MANGKTLNIVIDPERISDPNEGREYVSAGRM
jgi:hypothetical protein